MEKFYTCLIHVNFGFLFNQVCRKHQKTSTKNGDLVFFLLASALAIGSGYLTMSIEPHETVCMRKFIFLCVHIGIVI